MNEQNEKKDIKLDKEKFVLVQKDEVLYDEKFQTKAISYFQDAMIRFRKNKASVVAFVILMFLIFMAIIGPVFSSYTLPDRSQKWATRLAELPPRVVGLENNDFFNGSKTVTGYPAQFDSWPEGIVIELYPENTNSIGQIEAKIDYYAYTNYKYSQLNYTSLSPDEYSQVKAHDIQILNDDNPDNDDQVILIEDGDYVNGAYRVKLDFFRFLNEVYDTDVKFLFGSDMQGRDLYNQLWRGARLSLAIAFSVSSINIIIGMIVGSISGYFGGLTDLIIERFSEILSGLPFLAILTLLLLRYGSEVWVVILAFTLRGWLGNARITRAQFYRYKKREYVLAARTLAASDKRIMTRHILPNAIGTLITSFVLYIPSVIFTESTFSFLGIINYGEQTSIGRLLSNGQIVMKDSFYMVLFPAIFISLLMLSFNLFGNGLRDAFNPSLRGVDE